MNTAEVNLSKLRNSPLCFKSIYEIMFNNGDAVSCEYSEEDSIKKRTNSDYLIYIKRAASILLRTLGTENRGSFVGIKLENSPNWPVVFWAVLMCGYKVVLIDANLSNEMTDYLLKECHAHGIISMNKYPSKNNTLQISLDTLMDEHEKIDIIPYWEDEIALCTSGTTSTSKIYIYNGEALCQQIFNAEYIYESNDIIKIRDCDKLLAFLPFHHILGFSAQYLWCTFLGSTLVYLKDRAPETIMGTCRKHKVTHIITVPLLLNNLANGMVKKVSQQSLLKRAMFKLFLNTSLLVQKIEVHAGINLAKNMLFKGILSNVLGNSIRCIICGGSHAPYDTLRLVNGLGYYTTCGFGMTEVGITSCNLSYSLKNRLKGFLGTPLPSVEYKIQGDADSSCGELLIKGSSLHCGRMIGGVKHPSDIDEKGWFATGDMGSLTQGSLRIEGRLKDVIIVESGENVYPDELEDHFSNLPGVLQLSVVGTKKDDKNDFIALVLYMKEDAMVNSYLKQLGERLNNINKTLPINKKVSKVYITSEPLPSASGIKVKRVKLKEMLEKSSLNCTELNLKEFTTTAIMPKVSVKEQYCECEELLEIKEDLRKIFSEVLNIASEDIKNSSHFVDDLGGDSLNSISLLVKVENKYKIVISDSEYLSCCNIDDLSLLIAKKLGIINSLQEVASTSNASPKKVVTKFEESREYISFMNRISSTENQGNPYFICHDSSLKDVSTVDGREVLNLGSYNYIGMSGHPDTVKAAQEAAAKYGTSASGSRLLAGEKHLYQELEKEISSWKHTEAALVLVGGHSTNVTFVGNFCNENDLILYDALSHNSIVQGTQLSKSASKAFPHNDFNALENILINARGLYEKILLVVEGVYSMDGDIAPIPEFVRLKKKYNLFLMVDEAHSACVIGENGGGVDDYFNLQPNDIDIKMGTLSKGLGTCGGYLAGSYALIEYLRYNVPGFVFSVGINPPSAAATLEAIRILRRDNSMVKKLHENIRTFVEEAHRHKLNTCLAGETAIIPIMIGKDEDAFVLSSELLKRGVFVPPAVYPAVPKGQARLRFCVTSEHKKEQIVYALKLLMETAREFNINI